MRKLRKLLLISTLATSLGGCSFNPLDFFGKKEKPITDPIYNENDNQENENKDQGENNNQQNENQNEGGESTPTYADWPIAKIAEWVEVVKPGCTEVIPSFNKATKIELDTEIYETEGYFGIYCKTTDANSENEYKKILEDASWTINPEKTGIFYDAFSPSEQLWMNFGYDSELKELDIAITECPIISWPQAYIEESVGKINNEATDTIPSFKANTYVATYYSQFNRLAINGYGVETNILNTYKTKVENAGWITRNGNSGDYFAVSPNNQLEINFYYEANTSTFNVDVAKYVEQISGWPLEEINLVLTDMDVTGTVEPFPYENKGFSVDTDYYPPAILVEVKSNAFAQECVTAYNNLLVSKGYVLGNKVYGENTYHYPGTTLAYRATFLNAGPYVTIELFNFADI